MELFRRIFFAAVLAGAVAGLALAVIQQWRIVPLITQAELYVSGHAHDAAQEAVPDHADGEVSSEPWAPSEGGERIFYTVLATTLVSMGFALMLGAVAILSGIDINLKNGVIWGLGGFITFTIAPSFGLPPGLPGMDIADLGDRQIWWWGTAIVTGLSLLGMAKMRTPAAIALGLGAILVPHIVGAPGVAEYFSQVPANLASAFTISVITSSLVCWLITGVLLGWFIQRSEKGN